MNLERKKHPKVKLKEIVFSCQVKCNLIMFDRKHFIVYRGMKWKCVCAKEMVCYGLCGVRKSRSIITFAHSRLEMVRSVFWVPLFCFISAFCKRQTLPLASVFTLHSSTSCWLLLKCTMIYRRPNGSNDCPDLAPTIRIPAAT